MSHEPIILIDGTPDYMIRFVFNGERDEFVDPTYNPKPQFSDEVIQQRNKSITETWADPNIRAEQSARASANYNHDPEIHEKRSKGMKKFMSENPNEVQKLSTNKTEYWKKWRAERGLPDDYRARTHGSSKKAAAISSA